MDNEKIKPFLLVVFGVVIGIGALGLVFSQGNNTSALAFSLWPWGWGRLSPPANLNATYVDGLSEPAVLLTWSDNNKNETGFEVERSSDFGGGGGGFVTIGTSGKDETGYLDQENLIPGTTYYYHVRSFRQKQQKVEYSPYSEIASVSLPIPSVEPEIAYKSSPRFSRYPLPTYTLINGEQILLRFVVSAAPEGDISIHKFALNIATTNAQVNNINIYAYIDSSFTSPVPGLSTDGGMLAEDLNLGEVWGNDLTDLDVVAQTSAGSATSIVVPASTPAATILRYFEVRGTVSNALQGSSVSTFLLGDAAYPIGVSQDNLLTAAEVEADVNNNFIWSPNTTSRSGSLLTDPDWTNGYRVWGLPGDRVEPETLFYKSLGGS